MTVIVGGHTFHHKTPLQQKEGEIVLSQVKWRDKTLKEARFPEGLLVFTAVEDEAISEASVPDTMLLPATWSDTTSNPGELFVFGRFVGLRLDGSKGMGTAVNKQAFDDYVKWYNEIKGENVRYQRCKKDGSVLEDIPELEKPDLPF